MKLTTKDYLNALQNSDLDQKEIDILTTLYKFPDSTANTKELSGALGYKWQGFAFRIGTIGKKISDYLGKMPNNYITGGVERPAYFMFVGPYYIQEGKTRTEKPGWEMNKNLMEALENLKLV